MALWGSIHLRLRKFQHDLASGWLHRQLLQPDEAGLDE